MQTLAEVKSAHFTVCQKPWGCWKTYDNRLCGDLHRRWFELRREAEEFYSLPVTPDACPKGGPKHYVPMALEHARFPYNSTRTRRVVPDDSREFWAPIAEGRYTSDRYN